MLFASLYDKEEGLGTFHENLSSFDGEIYGEFDICFYVEILVIFMVILARFFLKILC